MLSISQTHKGILYGLGAVLIWGSYLALARLGVSTGLKAPDFAFMRFATAGLIMLPWLLSHRPSTLAGVGWKRGLALTLFAGPLFILLGAGGFQFAPLAHGAVVQPATIVIATTLLAWWVFADKPNTSRLLGSAIILIGLVIIAGPNLFVGNANILFGDVLFFSAGLLWAVFTILTRRWAIKSIPATAVVSVLSMLIVIPAYLLMQDLTRIAQLSLTDLLIQLVVQGVLSGVIAVILFTRAAEMLGPARAAIFPALVPAAGIIIGIPVTGELPNSYQIGGLFLVSIGLLVAIGIVKRPGR